MVCVLKLGKTFAAGPVFPESLRQFSPEIPGEGA